MYSVSINGRVSALKLSDSSNSGFDELFLEAVDEAIASLGDSCKQAIYFNLEETFKIKKHEIPFKVEEFVNAIEAIFGLGAKLIEIQIMKCLHKKLGDFRYLPDEEELTFTEYVTAAKMLDHFSKSPT